MVLTFVCKLEEYTPVRSDSAIDYQWISVNQLRSLPEGATTMAVPVAMGAYICSYVTVPSFASVYNEYALKSQYDTSIHLQQEAMDPNFKLLDTCDLDTQGLIAALNATADAEFFCDDGKKQERKRRLIEVDDDEVDTDVEITFPPTQSSQPGKQTSTGSGSVSNSKKPMIQSSIYGGIGSSSKAHQGKKNQLLLQYVEGGGVPSRLQKMEKKGF
ncbi:hypothetical protein YC2023_058740 [Brassica napus]